MERRRLVGIKKQGAGNTMKTNYILKNGRVIDPTRKMDRKMDVGISNGKIVQPTKAKDAVVIDLKGLVVAPGLIDMHVICASLEGLKRRP